MTDAQLDALLTALLNVQAEVAALRLQLKPSAPVATVPLGTGIFSAQVWNQGGKK